MNSDGSNVKRLTNDPGKDVQPCWSPDGERIVWASNRTGDWDIWTMDADGTNQDNLTENKDRQDTNPMWATSENLIAFVSNKRFYTIRPDGQNIFERTGMALMADCQPCLSSQTLRFCLRNAKGQLLLREGYDFTQVVAIGYGGNGVPAQAYNPAFSSDAKMILFDSGGASPKLYDVDLESTSCEEIAMEGFGADPVFANQDTAVAFTGSTGVGQGSDIFIVDLDASTKVHGLPKPTNLTHNPANDNQPAFWEPPATLGADH